MAYSGGSASRYAPSQPYAYLDGLSSDTAQAHNMDNFSQNASTGFSLPGLSFSNSFQGPGSEQTPINLDDDDDEDYYGESPKVEAAPQLITAIQNSVAHLAQPTLAQKETSHAVRDGSQTMNGVGEQEAGRELQGSNSSFSLPGLGSFSDENRARDIPQSATTATAAQVPAPSRQASAYITVNTTRPSNARMDHERVITAFQGKYAFAIETLRQLHECGISFEQLLALDLFSDRDKADLAQLFVQAGLSSGRPPSVRDVNEQLLKLVDPTINAVPQIEARHPLSAPKPGVKSNGIGSSISNGLTKTSTQPHRSLGDLHTQVKGLEAPAAQMSAAPTVVQSQTNAPAAATSSTTPTLSANAGPADRSTYLARLQAAKLKKSPLTSQRTSPINTTNSTPAPVAPSVISKPALLAKDTASVPTNVASLASSGPSTNTLGSGEGSTSKAPDRLDRIRQKMEQLRAQMAQGKTAGNVPASGSATPPTAMVAAPPSDIIAPPDLSVVTTAQNADDLDQSDVEMEEDENSDDSDDYEPEVLAQPEPVTPHISSTSMPVNDSAALPFALPSQSDTPTPAATNGLNPHEQALRAKEAEISAMKERIQARARERLASAREATAQTPNKVTAQGTDVPSSGQGVSQATPIDLTADDTTSRGNGYSGLPPRPQTDTTDSPGLASSELASASPVVASLPAVSGATSSVLDRGRQVSHETPKRTATSPLRNGDEDKRQRTNDISAGKSTPVPMSAKARRLLEIQEEMRRVQEALDQEEADREKLVQALDALGIDTEGKSLEELEGIQRAMQQATKSSVQPSHASSHPESHEQPGIISDETADNAMIDHQPPISAQPITSFEVAAPSAIHEQSALRPSTQQLLESSNIQGGSEIVPTQPQGGDGVPTQIEISDDSTESDTAGSGESSDAMSLDNEDIHTPGEPIDTLVAPTEVVEASQRTRLHVKNLPYSATEEDVRSFFDQFSVEDIEICTHPQSGRSKGFGFVTLPSFSDAQLAIQQLDAHRMGTDAAGRQIKLRIARNGQNVSSAAEVDESLVAQQENTTAEADDDEYEPALELDSRTDEINRLPDKVAEEAPVQESEDLTDESMNESSDEGEISEQDVTDVPAPRPPPTGPRNPQPASFQPSNGYPTPPTGPRAYVQQGYASSPNYALPRSGPSLGRPLYPILGLKYPENAPKATKAVECTTGAPIINETDGTPDIHIYDSPLKNFKSYRYHPDYNKTYKYQSLTYSHKLDADLPLCPTELQEGECPDRDCIFQHFSQARLDGSSLLAELGGRNPEPTLDNAVYAGGLRELIKDMKARSLENTEDICSEIVTYSNGSKKDPTRVLTI